MHAYGGISHVELSIEKPEENEKNKWERKRNGKKNVKKTEV